MHVLVSYDRSIIMHLNFALEKIGVWSEADTKNRNISIKASLVRLHGYPIVMFFKGSYPLIKS